MWDETKTVCLRGMKQSVLSPTILCSQSSSDLIISQPAPLGNNEYLVCVNNWRMEETLARRRMLTLVHLAHKTAHPGRTGNGPHGSDQVTRLNSCLYEASSRICCLCEGSPGPSGKCLFCPLDHNILARTSHLLRSLFSPLMVHLEAHSYMSKAGFHLFGWPTCSQSVEPIVTCNDLQTSFSLNCIIWGAQHSTVTFTQESIFGSKQLLHQHLMLLGGAYGSISAWRSACVLLLIHQTSYFFWRFLTEMLSFPHRGNLLTSWLLSFILTTSRLSPQGRHKHTFPQPGRLCSWCLQTGKTGRGISPLNWSGWGSFILIIKSPDGQEELSWPSQVGFWQADQIFPTFTLQVVLKQNIPLMCPLGNNISIWVTGISCSQMLLISPSSQKYVPVSPLCATVSFGLENFLIKFNVGFLKGAELVETFKLTHLRVADLDGCFYWSCYDAHVRRDGKSRNVLKQANLETAHKAPLIW